MIGRQKLLQKPTLFCNSPFSDFEAVLYTVRRFSGGKNPAFFAIGVPQTYITPKQITRIFGRTIVMNHGKRNPDPYRGVDWAKVHRVQGCTHMHCQNRDIFNSLVAQGLEFATFSNYYPSAPTWPIREIYENTFRLGQASYLRNHRFYDEPLDFRKEFARYGIDAELPDGPGPRKYPDPPAGFLEAPNAEHAWFSDYNVYLHVCAVGSTLTTSMDRQNAALLKDHGYELGCPVPWREAFDLMLDKLIIPDGGGITINHPNWSHLPVGDLCAMLDHDPRVLGIEIFSNDADGSYSGQAEPAWNAVLATGRQCFGFCVQDHLHGEWKGRSILLVDERTPEACLRAYREGRFYGAVLGHGLSFDFVHWDGENFHARCDRGKCLLQVISRVGVAEEFFKASEARFTVRSTDRAKHGFLRLTAFCEETGEKLYTQPIMLV